MANNSEKNIFKLLNKYASYSQSNLEKVNFKYLFKEFIKNGGNINEKNSKGITVLMLESQISGSYEIMEALFENGADPNIQDITGKTALLHAAIGGNSVAIEELIAEGANINIKDNNGKTALMYACDMKIQPYGKYKDAVFNLIHDPDLEIDARDIMGKTALYYCIESKADSNIKQIVLKELLEKDADPSIADIHHNESPLMTAIANKDINIVKLLLQSDKIDINYQNSIGATVLHQAVLDGLDFVELVLAKNPNLELKDNRGSTPLQYLYDIIIDKDDYEDILIMLVEDAHADINSQENDGNTLLMKICKSKNTFDAVKVLLKLPNININLKNAKGETAYDIAVKAGNTEIAKLLKPKSSKKWKGSSRADIEKYDVFFEKPTEWTTCPICLDFVERSDGCMFIMGHDCAKTGHHYNKELYEKYAYEAPYGTFNVEWCTICGRITEFHKHFKLVSASADRAPLAKIDANVERRLNAGDNQVFFDTDNCKKFGGGGLEEKAARFRRLREYALELQDDIDTKLEEDALDELIEEIWNAPLRREPKKIKKILEEKKFNIPSSNFPNIRPNVTRNNNNTRNYPNIPMVGQKPTIANTGSCVIGGEDVGDAENPVYLFHHDFRGGKDHSDLLICKDDLEGAMTIKNKEFGTERFTKCWEPTCNAILYPGEIEGIVSDVLYQEYRKKFNKKMVNVINRNINRNRNRNENENENNLERIDRLAEMNRNQRGGKRITRKNKRKQRQTGGDIDHVLHKLDVSTVTCNRIFKKKK